MHKSENNWTSNECIISINAVICKDRKIYHGMIIAIPLFYFFWKLLTPLSTESFVSQIRKKHALEGLWKCNYSMYPTICILTPNTFYFYYKKEKRKIYFKYKSPSTIWVIIVWVWRVLIDVVEWGMCQYCVQNCLRPLIYLFFTAYVFYQLKSKPALGDL